MQNRIGNKRLTEAQARDMAAEVRDLLQKLDVYTISLEPDERRRVLRMRTGAEPIAQVILSASDRAGVVLPVTTQDVRNDLETAQGLEKIRAEVEQLLERLDDSILRARHEAWHGATSHYTSLNRLAVTDGAIQAAIAPVVEWFATGPRAKKATSEPQQPTDATPDA